MSHDRRLAELHHPRRNRYYAGKILAASDLEIEQEYLRGADAQLARHVLGAGVVCGLDVTAGTRRPARHPRQPGPGARPWGRRIVVPRDVEVELPARARLPASMVVRLRYEAHEADFAPSVPGDDEDSSEAGTWVEGHHVEIREGSAPPATGECSEATLELIRAGEVDGGARGAARAACAAPPTDPGVTLATITVAADGGLTLDAHGARAVVPTTSCSCGSSRASRPGSRSAAPPRRPGDDVPLDLTSHDR